MKKIYLLLGIALGLCSCGGNTITTSNSSSSNVEEQTTLNIIGPNEVSIGDVVKYTVEPNIDVSFQSSDDLVLSINGRGEATTFKEGQVTITATSKEDANVKGTLNVKVNPAKMQLPNDYLGITELINKAKELESSASEISMETIKTDLKETRLQNVKLYDGNFYIETIDDEYTNHSGYTHEITTVFNGVYQNNYYEIHDGNIGSYVIKQKIVDENAVRDNNEILESDAIKKGTNPSYVSAFTYDIYSLWGARTLDLKIDGEVTNEGMTLTLSNIYLFCWADGVTNESTYYETTLKFDNDGFLYEGIYQEIEYQENQYDTKINDFVEDAEIKDTKTVTFNAKKGVKFASNTSNILPTDYFVSSVTKANYAIDVHVNDLILVRNVELVEYEGAKALDIDEIKIIDVINDDDKILLSKDAFSGQYMAMQEGTAYLLCQMTYSNDVQFLVEIVILPKEGA